MSDPKKITQDPATPQDLSRGGERGDGSADASPLNLDLAMEAVRLGTQMNALIGTRLRARRVASDLCNEIRTLRPSFEALKGALAEVLSAYDGYTAPPDHARENYTERQVREWMRLIAATDIARAALASLPQPHNLGGNA